MQTPATFTFLSLPGVLVTLSTIIDEPPGILGIAQVDIPVGAGNFLPVFQAETAENDPRANGRQGDALLSG
jgi:hypothetical protein